MMFYYLCVWQFGREILSDCASVEIVIIFQKTYWLVSVYKTDCCDFQKILSKKVTVVCVLLFVTVPDRLNDRQCIRGTGTVYLDSWLVWA